MNSADRELDWLAFCYVAGEMTGEDAAAFERRLAEDHEACESVACAVELAEITSMVEDRRLGPVVPTRRTSAVWPRRVAWMSCGAAACLLLVALWQRAEPGVPDSVAFRETAESPARQLQSPELALAWIQARSTAPIVEIADAGPALVWDELSAELDALSGISAPSWMVTAVAGLTVGAKPVSPDEVQ